MKPDRCLRKTIVRDETPADYERIYLVTKAAFENHPYSQQTEQFIIKALRMAGALSVSLVAEIDTKVVGHIAFSCVTISDGSENWFGAGPLSVLPSHQRQGIGKTLVREGLSRLRAHGAAGCILVGDPRYYHQFGFKCNPFLCHEGVPQENVLVLGFDQAIPRGQVVFHPAFSARD